MRVGLVTVNIDLRAPWRVIFRRHCPYDRKLVRLIAIRAIAVGKINEGVNRITFANHLLCVLNDRFECCTATASSVFEVDCVKLIGFIFMEWMDNGR